MDHLLHHVYDPYILNISKGVPKEVIQVEDYAYDAAIIHLESLKVVIYLLALNPTDVGNCIVAIFSFIFLIMQPYDVNSRNTSW